jgi:hypothetical protein
MTTLKAHFDGEVLVPDEPVDLPRGCTLEVMVRVADEPSASSLAGLANFAEQFPTNEALPTDGAARHDHYLYGSSPRI